MTRTVWSSLPEVVRRCAETALRAPVTAWTDAVVAVERPIDRPAGVARTATGDGLFLKAARAEDAFAADYRAEARLAAVLPAGVPTPRLRLAQERNGWLILGFDVACGHQPAEPWLPHELRAVLNALDAAAPLLSSAPGHDVPSVAERMAGRCSTYRDLTRTGHRDELRLEHLSDFERHHLSRLAALEATWEQAAVGRALLHFDLRHDNLMLHESAPAAASSTPGDGAGPGVDPPAVTFLDWGRACSGQAWIDTVCLLLLSDTGSVRLEEAFAGSARAVGADPQAVDAFLVALASYWRHAAARPAPAPSLHLQARQRASGQATLRWLWTRWA